MSKRDKIIYWIATILMVFGMTASGIAQILQLDGMVVLITDLGYPLYFMYIIGVWKILGVTAILAPKFGLLKEWAYAGFVFLMSGALLSHIFNGDTADTFLGPVFQLIFICLSWYFRPDTRKITT